MMKRYSLLILFLILGMGIQAQEKRTKGGDHGYEHQMDQDPEPAALIYADKVTTRLGLTAEQKMKIKKAQMERLQAQMELKKEYMSSANEDGDKDFNYEANRKKIQENFKEEMKGILNQSQYSKWESMYKREIKMKEKKKENQG